MPHRRLPVALLLLLSASACTAKGAPAGHSDPAFAGVLEWREEQDELASSPIALTASDGSGLQLVTMDVKVVLEDPLAFTEMTLTFHNPENRVREGRFEINLPTGAAISRFAMMIDDRWQEAEVVERQAARVAFEDSLHRKQDPALLEKDAGNQFRARVFPIPANGTKVIKIAYSQELRSSKQPYQLLLAGLPRMDEFLVDVAVVKSRVPAWAAPLGVEHLTIHEREFAPWADLEVRFEREITERGLRSGSLAVGRIAPVVEVELEWVTGLTVLLDTSASRALGFEGQVDRLTKLLATLAAEADFPLEVLCFDQSVELVYQGSARELGAEVRARILERHPLGASDLVGALTTLAERDVHPRVLVVTDGIITAGEDGHEALRDAVARLGSRGVERLDALVDGGLQDELTLQALTRGALTRNGVIASARLSEAALVYKLTHGTRSGIEVAIPGADSVWPRTLDGVQPGDEVVVYAQLPEDTPMIVELRERGAVRRVDLPTREAQGPLLERVWTRAKIDRMTAELLAMPRDDEGTEAARQAIVDLSVRKRVLSDFTALLVLETDADYWRFGIDRNALADILTVGPGGIEVLNRTPWKLELVVEEPPPEEPDNGGQRHKGEEGKMGRPSGPPIRPTTRYSGEVLWGGSSGTEIGEAHGVGGLGLIGTGRGEGGGGEGTIGLGNTGFIGSGGGGSGAGFGGRGQRVPEARIGRATIVGAMDRDILRRIVRAHINEVRSCYNRTLVRDPQVAGRVTIEFVIGSTGKISTSHVFDNSTSDTELGRCIASAVKRWQFPRPRGGGVVTVRYPFSLSPGRTTAAPRETSFSWFVAEPATQDPLQAPGSALRLPPLGEPWEGRLAEVMAQLGEGKRSLAMTTAWQWRESEPSSELALLALGEAAEANGDLELASRAYGSLIDLFPSRADIRRMAGERLERVALGQGEGAREALQLAVDTYREAVEQRPDHPSSHRLYAYALVKAGRHEDAYAAIVAGIERHYPGGRFAGVWEILREDAGILAAAWIAARPQDYARVLALQKQHGFELATEASTRFVLNWETDANDVDFHIYDAWGGHASFSNLALRSGGRLYADVTTGYGPECFTIEGVPAAGPYTLQAHYFAKGPMGYGMGKLEILRHDGRGKLSFDERPFVIMKDGAFIDLGKG